jgi:hypothetical protein
MNCKRKVELEKHLSIHGYNSALKKFHQRNITLDHVHTFNVVTLHENGF